jgi:hypothetical protein
VAPAAVVVAPVEDAVVPGFVVVGTEVWLGGTLEVVTGSSSSPVLRNQMVSTAPNTTRTMAKRPQLTRRLYPSVDSVTESRPQLDARLPWPNTLIGETPLESSMRT